MNVYYTDTAKQQLKELERHFQKRILDKVAVYASLPNPLEFAEPLAGYDMNRFRVGDYRVAEFRHAKRTPFWGYRHPIGTPGLRVHTGFHDHGNRNWNADRGDDRKDSPC